MKYLIPLILIAFGVALLQHRKIQTLDVRISQSQAALSSSNRSHSLSPRDATHSRQDRQSGADLPRINQLIDRLLELESSTQSGEKFDGKLVNQLIQEGREQLENISVEKALSLIKNESADSPRVAILSVLLRSNNPEVSIAITRARISPSDQESALSHQLNIWGRKDPQALLAWYCIQLKNGATDLTNAQIRRTIFMTRAHQEPATALAQLIEAYGQPDFEFHRSITTNFLEFADYVHFFSELKQTPKSKATSEIKTHFMQRLNQELTAQNHEVATDFIATHFDEQETATFAKDEISRRSDVDRPKWADWLAEQPDLQPFESFISGWTINDYLSAGQWLTDFPPGDVKNRAITQYAFQIAVIAPDVARQWAETLPNSPEQKRLLRQIKNRNQEGDRK